MSRYIEYDCKSLRNLEVLLAALASFGWSEGKVEVHDQPVTLFGYHGDARPEKANVVIRRGNTGVGMSNDIGFLRNADGTYTPIVSEYDSRAVRRGLNGVQFEDGGFVNAVTNAYGKVMGDKAVNTLLTRTIPKLKAQGLIPRHATAITQRIAGATKVLVRY